MKIRLSKSQWEEMGKKAGWSSLDKNKILDDAFDFLNSAEKQLSVAGETDLAIELQKFSMKVLDRKQRKTTGTKMGQVKESQNMNKRMDDFFSPSIALKRHMMNGKVISGYWYVDLNKDFQLAKQLIEEAGIKGGSGNKIPDSDLDAFEIAAGKHGYSVETIGE